jgi:uncharacterized protein (DUF433 family)
MRSCVCLSGVASQQRIPSLSNSYGEAVNEIAYGFVGARDLGFVALASTAAGAPSFTDQRPPGYTASMEFKRITTNPRQMGGVPCLRGLRIPVATVVALVAEGQTAGGILALYPDLEADDMREALLFAAEAVRERALPLAAGE